MKPSVISKQFIILALGAGCLALQPSAFGARYEFSDDLEADGASGSFQATILGVNTTLTVPPVGQLTLHDGGSASQSEASYGLEYATLRVLTLHEVETAVQDIDDPDS